jgi:hypothetical protein
MRTSLVAFAFLFACGGAQPAAPEAAAPAPAPREAAPAPLIAAEPETPVETVNEQAAAEPAPTTDAYVPPAQDEIFVRQVVSFLDEMVVMMEATQDNCDRMADGLEILMRKNQPLIAQSKLMGKEPKRDAWFKQQAEAQMMKMIERLLVPMQKCQANKKVQAAFDKFGK